MSKTARISNRIKRIEDRFKIKVSKGRKGTDMDIEIHERRIEKLRGKQRKETIKQERNMPEGTFGHVLGFIMPHSPLNQNDSIAAAKAFKLDKENYMKREFRGNDPRFGPITSEQNAAEAKAEQSTKYFDLNLQKLKLIPTDDGEQEIKGFRESKQKWQFAPLNK